MMEIREEEFDRAVRALTKAMDEGFSGVHKRLDRVNGRLDRHDDELQDLQIERAKQQVRLENDDNKPALTRREAQVIKGIVGALVALAPILIWWFSKQQ